MNRLACAALFGVAMAIVASAAGGSAFVPRAVLRAEGGAAGDSLGRSVALDGDVLAAGAAHDDVEVPGGPGVNRGSVEVFRVTGGVWAHEATLRAPDTDACGLFGAAVALDGGTLVVGSPYFAGSGGAAQGAVYVFVDTGGAWVEEAVIVADDGVEGDNFGSSVALEGDTLVVGAPADEESAGAYQGSVYVYVRTGGVWARQAKLTDADAGPGDSLGVCVALDGDTLAAGAFFDDGLAGYAQGSASVFVRSAGVWSQQAKLTAADAAALDLFGQSVAVEGDTLAVGAFFADLPGGINHGTVVMFERSGGAWSEAAVVSAADAAPDDNFGYSVAMRGDVLAVGAAYDDGAAGIDQGGVYVFRKVGSAWVQEGSALAAPEGSAGDALGYSVALDGEWIASGAAFDDEDAGEDVGSVVVFGAVCAGDANGDARVDAADLSVLLAGFGTTVPAWSRADFNGDGLVDAADLSVLLASFGRACLPGTGWLGAGRGSCAA